MNFSLIICTYQRPQAVLNLLNSVEKQTVYPNEILIIDGSLTNLTEEILKKNHFKNINYIKVSEKGRGLTKQRNIGINAVHNTSEIICFLDDDTILEPTYFEHLIHTYKIYPDAIGVGGYITNEVNWENATEDKKSNANYYCIDGFCRREALRFKLRKRLGLIDDTLPGFMPAYSHGRSISYLPPSGKIYSVEFFMGGVSSFKKEIFNKIKFSTYFEGYGLYEDLEFCLRASKYGQLYVNTNAKLAHFHEAGGRPNQFNYGKMVVRNGWYVWRVKYPNPTFKAKFTFYFTALFLLKLRFLNGFIGSEKKQALTESLGRFYGLLTLLFNKPKIEL